MLDDINFDENVLKSIMSDIQLGIIHLNNINYLRKKKKELMLAPW